MKNFKKTIIGFAILTIFAGCQATPQQNPTTPNKPEDENTQKVESIKIDNITDHQVVTSPLEIRGEVRGNWMFEAVFDIEIQTSDGLILGKAPAITSDNWMTTEFVRFQSTLTFDEPIEATEGKLIFLQASPAGDEGPEPQFFEIPVRFEE